MLQEKEQCQSPCCASTKQETVASPNVAGKQLSWKIDGMDCPSCASKVEYTVKDLEGVQQARVSFATERLLVVVNEDPHVRKRILKAVNDAGFEIAGEEPEGFL